MRRRRAGTGAGLVLAVACLLPRGSAAQPPVKAEGTSPRKVAVARALAPRFSLPAIDGKRIDLGKYRGKVVLLDFWATWCAPCRTTIPRLIEVQERYGDRGVQIIGVSLDDDPSAVRAADRQFRFNYPVVIGDAALAERYGGVLGLPVLFVIACDGRIEHRFDGETDLATIEQQVEPLLQKSQCGSRTQGH